MAEHTDPLMVLLLLSCRYQGLGGARECPRYLVTSGGARRGCNFTQSSLPIFTDINMCVNGSAPEGPLRPGFLYLQIQNHGALTVHLHTPLKFFI